MGAKGKKMEKHDAKKTEEVVVGWELKPQRKKSLNRT